MLEDAGSSLGSLELTDVWKDYAAGRRGRRPPPAVRGVSLRVAPGEIVGLAGESGSGKSSIARLAAGLMEPTSGSIAYEGVELASLSRAARRRWRRDVQIVFQDPSRSLNPRKTVEQTIALPLKAQQLPVDRETIDRALHDVGLAPAAEYLGRYPHQLSGGQRQRVAIARAIVLRPRILLADEPVSALDVSVRGQILLLLKQLSAQLDMGVLLVSHDLGVLRYACSRMYIMSRGQIVETGTVSTIFEWPQHPYTHHLLHAMPKIGYDRLDALQPPLLAALPEAEAGPGDDLLASGCSYRHRCPISIDRCVGEAPGLRSLDASGQEARCHRAPLDRVTLSRTSA